MTQDPAPGGVSQPGKPWWREAEAAWLLVLVLAVYFLRAGTLPIRGEEPTRVQIAREMVERGDWLMPREQGDPFLIRPPLQNWVIAASCLALRNWDAWTVRFPSLLATLLTTLMIYGYSRTFLSRTGAWPRRRPSPPWRTCSRWAGRPRPKRSSSSCSAAR